jgi:hypothetical protein
MSMLLIAVGEKDGVRICACANCQPCQARLTTAQLHHTLVAEQSLKRYASNHQVRRTESGSAHAPTVIKEICIKPLGKKDGVRPARQDWPTPSSTIHTCCGTVLAGRVVDPDWIRIQWLCGSGSVLGIRIRIQGQENEISVEKCPI